MIGVYSGIGPTAPVGEKRGARRFHLRLDCRVWSPPNGGMEAVGITGNMSRSGVLVKLKDVEISSQLSRVGEVARVVIDLPHSPHISPRCLECMAEVTRVAKAGPDEYWMALRIHRTRVLDRKDV